MGQSNYNKHNIYETQHIYVQPFSNSPGDASVVEAFFSREDDP